MVESVDTEDLKSFALRRGGSSPSMSIKIMKDLKENTIKTFQETLKYSLNIPNGNRSSKRTDILHKLLYFLTHKVIFSILKLDATIVCCKFCN